MERKLKVLYVLLAIVTAIGLSGAAMACPSESLEFTYYSNGSRTEVVGGRIHLCCPCGPCWQSWGQATRYYDVDYSSCRNW